MMLFKKKPSPQELVKATRDALVRLDKEDSKKVIEEIAKLLPSIKSILYGDGAVEPSMETILLLSQEIHTSNILSLLVQHMAKLDFESKKDVGQIFNNLLRRQVASRFPTAEHLASKEETLLGLIDAYNNPDIALNCGIIIRECVRHEQLCRLVINSPHLWKFFQFVESSSFDVSSDAFASFKDILTRHKPLVAGVLEANYDKFFEQYTQLLNSKNYVTQRQSLKLLGEILLDRTNFNIMTKYISNPENLKVMMNLLRDKSKNIQFEAFHVFKIFVANPSKPKAITEILLKNKEKLVNFLSTFHNDRSDDEQFNDEKAFLIKRIEELQ